MRRKRECNDMPVMKAACATCPFGEHGDPAVATSVLKRTLGKASQLCHHPTLNGKRETHLCRGARDIQLRLLCAMGAISEPTDEAFQAKWAELKGQAQ